MTIDFVNGEIYFKDPRMEKVAKAAVINLKPASIIYFFPSRYVSKWYMFILQVEYTQHAESSQDSADGVRCESDPIHKALGRTRKPTTGRILGIGAILNGTTTRPSRPARLNAREGKPS